jgi:hypothetical protein
MSDTVWIVRASIGKHSDGAKILGFYKTSESAYKKCKEIESTCGYFDPYVVAHELEW